MEPKAKRFKPSVAVEPMSFGRMLEHEPEVIFMVYESLTLVSNFEKSEKIDEVQWGPGSKQYYNDIVRATHMKLREASLDIVVKLANYPDQALRNGDGAQNTLPSIFQLAKLELGRRTIKSRRQG